MRESILPFALYAANFGFEYNRVRVALLIGSVCIGFHEILCSRSIALLKLAENLFACCRTLYSLDENSRIRTGRVD